MQILTQCFSSDCGKVTQRVQGSSVAEPETHHFGGAGVGAGAVTRCGSGSGSGSDGSGSERDAQHG
jgi:hypothetical protein